MGVRAAVAVALPCGVVFRSLSVTLVVRGRVRHVARVLASRGSVFQVLCRGDWRRVVTLCPVLKHGPRSARDAQVVRVVLGLSSRGWPHLKDPCVWNGRSESNSWVREPWGNLGRIAGRAVWSRCDRFRVRAYLLRPERW